MPFCPACGAQMGDNTKFCPACGKSISAAGGAAPTPASAPAAGGAMADNVAGMLAYVTFIPAIIFLAMEPYNKRPFVRFHSFQSIFLSVAWFVLFMALSIVGMIPVIGWATLLLWPLVCIAGLILWIMCLLKANSGQMWKLPVVGEMAAKNAGT